MAAGISEDRAPDRLPDPDPAYPIILPNGEHFDQATMHKAMQSRLPQVLRAVDEGLKGDPIYEWQTNDRRKPTRSKSAVDSNPSWRPSKARSASPCSTPAP